MSQAGIVSISAAAGIVDSVTGTNGVIVSPTTGNAVVQLANRVQGTATTTDAATPMTVLTIPLGSTPGTYVFYTNVTVFDITDSLGAGFVSYSCVRTTGAAGALLGSNLILEAEEDTLSGLSVGEVISSNSFSVVVNGLIGKTIDYLAVTTYIFTS